jgi:hypothetical protein
VQVFKQNQALLEVLAIGDDEPRPGYPAGDHRSFDTGRSEDPRNAKHPVCTAT